jgi:hypothetical protein
MNRIVDIACLVPRSFVKRGVRGELVLKPLGLL